MNKIIVPSMPFRLMVLALLLLMLPRADAFAGALSVAPTRVTLDSGRASGSVTLTNNADTPTIVQVETFTWQGGATTENLTPTRDILAVPAVFELAPGARQVIRVASRVGDVLQGEQTYRLLITEVPPAGPGPAGGVQFALRLSLPVFITPSGAVPHPVWAMDRSGGESKVVLRNEGNAHIHVTSLDLLSADGVVLETIDRPGYVLSGESRAWPVRAETAARGPLAVNARTSVGDLRGMIGG